VTPLLLVDYLIATGEGGAWGLIRLTYLSISDSEIDVDKNIK